MRSCVVLMHGVIVHCIPAITPANEPEPSAPNTLTPTKCACGAIPGCSYIGAPVPAVVPPQWEPCPWSSNGNMLPLCHPTVDCIIESEDLWVYVSGSSSWSSKLV